MSKRDLWSDYAKGIGILLVVYGHVARGVHKAGLPLDESLFGLVDSVLYSFHMPLFFFLSGLYFVGSLERYGAVGLVATKLRTVAWPYLVWSLVQGLVEVALSNVTNGNASITEVASLLWQPRAQFWFLYALFLVSLAALPLFRWLPVRWFPLVVLASAFTFVLTKDVPGGVQLAYVIRYLPYFAFGVLFNEIAARPQFRNWIGRLAVVLAITFAASQYAFHGILDLTYATEHRTAALSLAMVSLLAIVALCMWMEQFQLGLLADIGRASLGIYVMHVLAGSGVRILLQKFAGVESAAIHLALGTAAGVVLPLLAMRFFERSGLGLLFVFPRPQTKAAGVRPA